MATRKMSIHDTGFSDEKNQSRFTRYVTSMLKWICQYLYQAAEGQQMQESALKTASAISNSSSEVSLSSS